jgi:molybdopterin converting factor small subunit
MLNAWSRAWSSFHHAPFAIDKDHMITVRLPSTLKIGASTTLEVQERVSTIAQLIDVLDRRIPGFREQLDDSVFNFAVNDEMLLHRARERGLNDGDVVEIIPTISGG